MTDIATAPAETPEAADTPTVTPDVELTDTATLDVTDTRTREELLADIAKWKSQSRKNEDKWKAATAPTTPDERLAALEARAEAAERKVLIASVAAAHGVPEKALHGATEEDLIESAATFKASLAEALAAHAAAPVVPTPNDSAASGARGSAIASSGQVTQAEYDAMTGAEKIAALKDGRLATLLAG